DDRTPPLPAGAPAKAPPVRAGGELRLKIVFSPPRGKIPVNMGRQDAWIIILGSGCGGAAPHDGASLSKERCASCHEGGMERAPGRAALAEMTADRVLAAMETGPMISMASNKTAADRRAIAEFVTGKKITGDLVVTPPPQAMCANGPPPTF